MKHFISFTMLVFLAVGATGQTVHLLKPESSQLLGPIPPRIEKLESAEVIAPGDDLPIGTITSDVVTAIKVGEASNMFTFFQVENNQISAISASDGDAIAFIYRQSIHPCGGSTTDNGLIRYSISSDGGQTWDNGAAGLSSSGDTPTGCYGKGPVNPAYLQAGRYPNFLLSLPDSGQSLQDLKGIYAGGALNPLYPSIDDWDGMVAGVVDLVADSIPVISQEDYYFGNNDQHLPYSLVERIPGEYWTATWTYDARTDLKIGKILKINRGVYDGMSGTVSWANVATINPGVVNYTRTGFNSEVYARQNPVIAFSPDGQTGYVSFIGDIDDRDSVYLPILIRSSDAGNTWEAPIEVKLRQFEALKDTLQSFWSVVNTATGDTVPAGNGIPTTAFSHDMVVDKWGNPHVVCIVGNSGSIEADGTQAPPNYTIFGDGEKFVCDITLDTFGDPNVILLHNQATFRGYVGYGGGPAAPLTYEADTWIQGTRNPGGGKLFFSWTESDTTGKFGNSENRDPNLLTIGLDVENYTSTLVTNHTINDIVWSGRAVLPKMAPVVLDNGIGSYTLPVVAADIPPHVISGSGPTPFWYFSDITYTDADFTKDISFFYNCKENPITIIPTLDLPAFDSSNGAISLAVAGGVGAWHVSWNTADTIAAIADLDAGIYEVTVTDSLGCQVDTQIILNDQKAPMILLDSIANISCYGGQNGVGAVSVLLDSAATSATYLWSNGDTDSLVSGLAKGSYQLVVEDNLGCEAWLEIAIAEPDSLDILLAGTKLACYGDADGVILSSVRGGTASYSYNWSTGDTLPTISGLSAGSYHLTITDENGCQKSDSVEILQPDSLALQISGQMSWPCQNAFLTVNYTGGVDPIIFTWTGPDGIVGTSNILFGPLKGGTYVVTAQDANGCTTLDSILLDDCNTGVEGALSAGINNFAIKPNSTNGRFILTLNLEQAQDVRISILNLRGQVVSHSEEGSVSTLEQEINLENHPSGIYFVQVTTQGGTIGKKVLVRE